VSADPRGSPAGPRATVVRRSESRETDEAHDGGPGPIHEPFQPIPTLSVLGGTQLVGAGCGPANQIGQSETVVPGRRNRFEGVAGHTGGDGRGPESVSRAAEGARPGGRMPTGVQADHEHSGRPTDRIGEHLGALDPHCRRSHRPDLESRPGDCVEHLGGDGADSAPIGVLHSDVDLHFGTGRQPGMQLGQDQLDRLVSRRIDGEGRARHRNSAG